MKNVGEYLGFDDEEEKRKVGRPKLADKKTKKKSLIIAGLSFLAVVLLLVFGYGTLFGFNNFKLLGLASGAGDKNVLVSEVKPLIKKVTIKEGTSRKVYLTIVPSNAGNKKMEYKSSDTSVATVSADGKVTGVSEGNATITATSLDGSNKSASFDITVVKNASGGCSFNNLSKTGDGVDYSIKCDNAKVKEIQYKVGNDNYEKLLTKKANDSVPFSKAQLEEKITFKVVYYSNNSKVSKYSTKTLDNKVSTTKKVDGSCSLTIKDVKANSARYDITCNNASVSKIAYKIGNGSYVGLDASSLADTVLFEESDVTRVIYFNVEYKVDGSNRTKSISKSSIIQKGTIMTTEEGGV